MEEVCLQAEVIASPDIGYAEERTWQRQTQAKMLKSHRGGYSDGVMSIENAIELACQYEAQARIRRTPSTGSASSSVGASLLDSSENSPQETPRSRDQAPCRHAGEADAAEAEARRAQAAQELREARDKGRAEGIEMACKSAEAAGMTCSEVATLRTRFQNLCLTRIDEACRNAEIAGVPTADINEARAQARRLRLEVRRLHAAAELLDARRSSNTSTIFEACRRAELAGVPLADVLALQQKLARLYATCIEEACRRAEIAGVADSDIRDAREEATSLRASAALLAAKRSCFSFSFAARPML